MPPATPEATPEAAARSDAAAANAGGSPRSAIAAAEAGLKAWRATAAWSRADMLHKVADIMGQRAEDAARRITLETGKPIAQARREWGLSLDQFRWYAEEARRIYGETIPSTDGNNWRPCGSLGVGNVYGLAASADGRRVLAASLNLAMLLSDDGCASWDTL